MRILISGYHNPHYLTFTEYIENAARSIGYDVIPFNDRDHVFPGRLRKRIGFLQNLSLAVINRELVKLGSKTLPDIVLITGGHRISRHALQTLAGLKKQLVLWTTDAPRASDIMPGTGSFYHHIFCHGTEYRDIFHAGGLVHAEWLPMACDAATHRREKLSAEEKIQFGSDLVFVGSYYSRRAEILQALARHHLTVWGPGWEALSPDSPLRACLRKAHTPPDTWTKIYSASKIVLSIHYRNPENRFHVHQASPRVFEAMACGAFVLTDRQKDVLSLFKDGEHLVSFSDAADLDRKIAYFLKHAAERREIAEAGKREVLRNHTYDHRMRELFSRIGAPVSPAAPIAATAPPSGANHFAT